MRVLVISHPFPWITGGFRRSYEVLRRIAGPGIEVTLLLSPQMAHDLAAEIKRRHLDPGIAYAYLDEIEAAGVKLHPSCRPLIADLIGSSGTNPAPERHSWRGIIGPVIPASIGMMRLLQRFEQRYLNDPGAYDLIYSHHECLDTSMLAWRLARKTGIPFAILLHNEPFRRIRRILKIRPVRSFVDLLALVPELNMNLSQQFTYRRILRSPLFVRFLVISPAPLVIAGMPDAPHTVLTPANALTVPLPLLSGEEAGPKGDYVLFASRFSEEKGILELPGIWKCIHDRQPGLRLVVCGNYSPVILEKFQHRIRELSLQDSVTIAGYLDDQASFYTMVRDARLLLHPSHSDGFSMIILECLALRTPVVAWDLPAFTYYYRQFPAVNLVPEWDREAFCSAALRILDCGESLTPSFAHDKLRDFILRHRSWDSVAEHERLALQAIAGNR